MTTYAAGRFTTAVAVGDLNGDAKPDLVAANYGDGTASVLLGNGDGTFGAASTLLAGNGPESVALGDLNGDGKTDLIVANSGTALFDRASVDGDTLSIFPGNGDGTFAAKTSLTTPKGPQAVIAVDLNADGRLDLVSANRGANQIAIWLGNGDGTFSADPARMVTGVRPSAVAAGDVNFDGKIDLVVSNGGSSTVSVLLGAGDGTFAANLAFGTGPSPRGIALADVNQDGVTDILTANYLFSNISLLLGRGTGAFRAHVDFTSLGTPFSIAVGDVNVDGKPDIITANQDNNGSAVVLRGSFSGFQPKALFRTGRGPTAVALADLNADGKPDIVAANFNSGRLGVLLNALQSSTTTLISSEPIAPLRSTVQFTAVVRGPAGALTPPTGFVQFFNGTRSLGSVALRPDGSASIITSHLTLGDHTISARYVGDSRYSSSQATPLTQTIGLDQPAGRPLVFPTLSAVKLPTTSAPGEVGAARIRLENQGTALANGTVAVQLFLSTDEALSGDDVAVAAKINQLPLRLAAGALVTINNGFTVPGTLAAGTYFVLAKLTAVSGVAVGDVASGTAASATTFDAVLKFGQVGTRPGVVLTRTKPDGTKVVYRLSGPGTGSLSEDGSGNTDVSLIGTTAASVASITATGATSTSTLRNVSAAGPIGGLIATATTLTGSLQLGGGAGRITLGGVSLGSIATAGTLGALSILKDFDGSATIGKRLGSVAIGGLLTSTSRILAATLPIAARISGQVVATAADPRFHV